MAQVSVIIPNYNHALYLKQRIESVLSQTFQDIEVIVLDDCSTDDSRNIIEAYAKEPKVTKVIINKTNSGSTFSQWNKGIDQCSSEIVWIAESDDFSDANFLSLLVPRILEDENIGIAYCQSYKVDGENKKTGTWKEDTDSFGYSQFDSDFRMAGKEYIKRFLVNTNTIPNASGSIFRKKIYLAAGCADTDIKNCSDWLMWLKMSLISDVSYVAEPMNYFRYHNQSVIAKATKNINRDHYVEMHDRTMRMRFHQYLQNNYPNEVEISKRNYDYILKEHGDGGLYEIKSRRLLKGWLHIAKTLRLSKRNFLYIKAGLKQSVKHIIE